MQNKKVTIYIDESGIHKQIDHSTFALVYIEIDDTQSVEKSVLKIEKQYRIKDFHWTDHSWKIREKFISNIANLSFSVKIAIFRNPIKPAKALEWALKHLLVENNFYSIYIEGKKPRWVERQFKKTLRDKGISIRKLKHIKHESNAGVRIADAIAGLSRSYYDNPSGKAKKLWKIISNKITTQLLGGQTDG